jgi:hypothetical protein
MTGIAGQLRFHLGGAMNMGLTESRMKDFIAVLEAKVGKDESRDDSRSSGQISLPAQAIRKNFTEIVPP